MARTKLILHVFSLLLIWVRVKGDKDVRILKSFGGGSSSSTSLSSGGSSISSGGSSSSSLSSGMTGRGYSGSCCVSSCCSSGYRSGYALWWYRGYRATSSEGDTFLSELMEAQLALLSLSDELKAGGNKLLVNDCAFLDNTPTLLDGTHSNTTLHAYIDILNNRISSLNRSLDEEVNVEEELNTWFTDFWRLNNSCFDTASKESSDYESRILSAREEVRDIESLKNDWDLAIASGAFFIGAKWSLIWTMGSALATFFSRAILF